MERAVKVRGRVMDERHIELEEPIPIFPEEVEVVVRPFLPPSMHKTKRDAGSIFEFIKSLPGGTRTKEDIDQQIREERDSWNREVESER